MIAQLKREIANTWLGRTMVKLKLRALGVPLPPHVTVGRHCYGYGGTKYVRPTASCPVQIGAFTSIAQGVTMLCDCYHRTDTVSSYPLRTLMMHPENGNVDAYGKGPTRIGNDVWIGENATLTSGVTIGDGAVIGASSVVTGDVVPYSIVVGAPARLLRMRFSPEIVAAFLRIRWWEWSDDQIRAREPDFYGDVAAFVSKFDPG